MIDRLIAKILENPDKPARSMIHRARVKASALIGFSLIFYGSLVWLNLLGTTGKPGHAAWMTYLGLCLLAYGYLSFRSLVQFFNQSGKMLADLPKISRLTEANLDDESMVAVDEFGQTEKSNMLKRLEARLFDVQSSLIPRVVLNIAFISPWLGPTLVIIENPIFSLLCALLILVYVGYSTKNKVNEQISQIKKSIEYLSLKC